MRGGAHSGGDEPVTGVDRAPVVNATSSPEGFGNLEPMLAGPQTSPVAATFNL